MKKVTTILPAEAYDIIVVNGSFSQEQGFQCWADDYDENTWDEVGEFVKIAFWSSEEPTTDDNGNIFMHEIRLPEIDRDSVSFFAFIGIEPGSETYPEESV